jgi:hypothetical protein
MRAGCVHVHTSDRQHAQSAKAWVTLVTEARPLTLCHAWATLIMTPTVPAIETGEGERWRR